MTQDEALWRCAELAYLAYWLTLTNGQSYAFRLWAQVEPEEQEAWRAVVEHVLDAQQHGQV